MGKFSYDDFDGENEPRKGSRNDKKESKKPKLTDKTKKPKPKK